MSLSKSKGSKCMFCKVLCVLAAPCHLPDLISCHSCPFLSPLWLHCLPWTHQAHSCFRAFARVVPGAWNDPPASAHVAYLSYSCSVFKWHLIRKASQTCPLPISLSPFLPHFLLYSLLLSLSPIWKVYLHGDLFLVFMPPEFKQHTYQNFVFWEGRWKSLGERACGETQNRINKQLF